VLGALLLATGAACAARPGPAPAPEWGSTGDGFELQVVRPRHRDVVRNGAGLVEVTGRVGREWLLRADLVIAMDLSNSAFRASGIDLDRDGVTGRTHRFVENGDWLDRPVKSWTSDPDDTMFDAQLLAARNVISTLASPDLRVALLTYTDTTLTRALLGPPRRALDSLGTINRVVDPDGTDLRKALRRAGHLFLAAPFREPDRPRVVFLFSDGEPRTRQSTYWARRSAIEEAARLADRGIAVCTFGFGPEIVAPEEDDDDEDEAGFLDELARTTGCRHVPVEDPELLRFDLLGGGLPEALTLRNLTTDASGRAVRVLPSGVFDGFVEVRPGENVLEVVALMPDGRRLSAQRVIEYRHDEDEREATAGLLLRLRERARQLDAAGHPEPVGEGPPAPR
jgi:hypothetical protein